MSDEQESFRRENAAWRQATEEKMKAQEATLGGALSGIRADMAERAKEDVERDRERKRRENERERRRERDLAEQKEAAARREVNMTKFVMFSMLGMGGFIITAFGVAVAVLGVLLQTPGG